MSLGNDLLTILTDYHGGYRLMRRRIREYARGEAPGKSYKELKDEVLRTTLSRLKTRGLVENKKGDWNITKKGKNYIAQELQKEVKKKHYQETSKKTKSMIIAFDIPEEKKKKRNWLRGELVALGFEPLQKSVWFGPAPLPKEFIDAIHELNVLEYIKFFKATETEIV